jgi:D-glycero-D-manno-heptose 1,7-bisphosphate phosphatase
MPGAGKSSAVGAWVERGYRRLNRDERGGRLRDLLPHLERELTQGSGRVVLDNTYPSRAARSDVVEAAWRHDATVRCVWLDTSLEQAQVNVARRLIRRYGRLPMPEELREASRRDPGALAPDALFRWRRQLEEPALDEGFAALERVPFQPMPLAGYHGRAALLEYDGVLRRARSGAPQPRSPDDVELLPGARELLEELHDAGYRLLGVSHQPGVERGELSEAVVRACFDRTNELLGLELEVAYCPHESGPPRCWCQRPLPGLGVWFVEKHRLDPAACVVVGRTPAERTFAERNGFAFRLP